jgi:hypothetical protein
MESKWVMKMRSKMDKKVTQKNDTKNKKIPISGGKSAYRKSCNYYYAKRGSKMTKKVGKK